MAVISNEDNGGNSNGGGHMQQSIKKGSGRNNGNRDMTGSGSNCYKGNEGGDNNGKRAG
jgi:hypothetical protein